MFTLTEIKHLLNDSIVEYLESDENIYNAIGTSADSEILSILVIMPLETSLIKVCYANIVAKLTVPKLNIAKELIDNIQSNYVNALDTLKKIRYSSLEISKIVSEA